MFSYFDIHGKIPERDGFRSCKTFSDLLGGEAGFEPVFGFGGRDDAEAKHPRIA